jgi:hypothetical protein
MMTSGRTFAAWSCLVLLWTGIAWASPVDRADLASASADILARENFVLDDAAGPADSLIAGLPSQENPVGASTALISPVTINGCATNDGCIDAYLWSLYERTPKVDSIRQSVQRSVAVKRKGKIRTRLVTVSRLVEEDFTWKDLVAAGQSGLSLADYVIGGMDRDFKRTIYTALRAMDEAGLEPGITSAFRDDYRQSIASGNKAQVDRSFHGGSTRGGYGHGRAVDVVSIKGATRAERLRSSAALWTWIDTNGRCVGIGRPYLGRDAPHVAAVDGEEYAKHRGPGLFRIAAAPAVTKVNTRTARGHFRAVGAKPASKKPRNGAGPAASTASAKPHAKAPARQVLEPRKVRRTAANSRT